MEDPRVRAVLSSLPTTTQILNTEPQAATAAALRLQVQAWVSAFPTSVESDLDQLQQGAGAWQGDARMGDVLRYRVERKLLLQTAGRVLDTFVRYVEDHTR